MNNTVIRIFSVPLIFLLLLFYEIRWMYPTDPIISFPPFLYILFISLTFVIALIGGNVHHKSSAFYSFVVLEFLTVFFTYEHALIYPLASMSTYLTISLPLLLFLFSYNFTISTKEQVLPTIMVVICFIISVVYLIDRSRNMGVREWLNTDSGSYTVLYYVPFVLCLKNKLLRGAMLMLCLVSIFLSFKRGGIICLLGGIFVYAVICINQGKDWLKKSKRLIFAILPLILIVFVLVYINDSFDDFLFNRFSDIEKGGGSGRDKVYANVIEMIKSSTLFGLLLGHGYNTVLRDNYHFFHQELSAHNDFLECIYDYGIATFVAYVVLYINLTKLSIKLLKRKSFYAAPLMVSIVVFLLNSLVSHIYLYEWHFVSFGLFWGYIIACDEKEKYKQTI